MWVNCRFTQVNYNLTQSSLPLSTAPADDREPDDALSSPSPRRLSISAPISRKSVNSQANSPILSPSSCQLLEDGSTSTPKRNADGKNRFFMENLIFYYMCRDSWLHFSLLRLWKKTYLDTDQNAGKKPSVDDKENDNKNENTAGIKQENFPDDDFDSTSSGQPPFKKIRPDCELTANISGKKSFFYNLLLLFFARHDLLLCREREILRLSQ